MIYPRYTFVLLLNCFLVSELDQNLHVSFVAKGKQAHAARSQQQIFSKFIHELDSENKSFRVARQNVLSNICHLGKLGPVSLCFLEGVSRTFCIITLLETFFSLSKITIFLVLQIYSRADKPLKNFTTTLDLNFPYYFSYWFHYAAHTKK